MESRTQSNYPFFIALSGITFVALLLRVYRLDSECAWNDEMLSLRFLDAPSLATFMHQLREGDPVITATPVYFIIQYMWRLLFGPSVLAIRWLSIALGLGTVWCTGVLGRRIFDARAGLFAAVLVSFSAPHIYYAQECRFYSLLLFLAIVAVYTLVRYREDGLWYWLVLNILCNALMLGTHVFTSLLIASMGIWLLLLPDRLSKRTILWFAANALLTVSWLVWVSMVEYTDVYDKAFRPTQAGFSELLMAFLMFAGGRYNQYDLGDYLYVNLYADRVLAVLLTLLVVGFVITGLLKRQRWTQERKTAVLLCGVWLLFAPIALFLVSRFWRPCFLPRYVLYVSLAWYLLAGAAISRMNSTPKLRWCLVGLLVLCMAWQQTIRLRQPLRPDYASVITQIDQNAKPGEAIMAFKGYNYRGVLFNAGDRAPSVALYVEFSRLVDAIEAEHKAGRGCWVVLWQWNAYNKLENALATRGITKTKRTYFTGVPRGALYRIPATGS